MSKPNKDLLDRQDLCARRMILNAELSASVKDGGFSLIDFQDRVRTKLADDKTLNTPSDGTIATAPYGGIYVVDILAPAHEQGETWEAIVSGANGKLYCVKFMIEDDDVTISGTPEEIVKETDYDYVNEPEEADYLEGRKALLEQRVIEAGAPMGNQNAAGPHDGGGEGGGNKYKDGGTARVAADEATKRATNNTDPTKRHELHRLARDAHEEAARRTKLKLLHDYHDKTIKQHEWGMKVGGTSEGEELKRSLKEDDLKEINRSRRHGPGADLRTSDATETNVLESARKDDGKFSSDPNDHSLEAFAAKKVADKSGLRKDHEDAHKKFSKAAEKFKGAGQQRMADVHQEFADEHKCRMEACMKAGDASGEDGALEIATAEVNAAALNARHAVEASSNEMKSLATLEDILMYMPGGVHSITPSQNGKPVTVCVEVDARSADVLEAQRKKLEANGKKPFFSVQHDTEIAAFWPTEFFWDKRIDSTGSFVEGVWARGEWTKSGREAVEGKDFRTFSPTFFVDSIRNNADKPSKVICEDGARPNMGALENDPAFQRISPLWCRNAAGQQENVVRKCHDNLVASGRNPTLHDVQREVFALRKVWMGQDEVAEALEAGAPMGNKNAAGPHDGRTAAKFAEGASDNADRATAAADDEGTTKAHADASDAHHTASKRHEKASKEFRKSKDHDSQEYANYHAHEANRHFKVSIQHRDMSER